MYASFIPSAVSRTSNQCTMPLSLNHHTHDHCNHHRKHTHTHPQTSLGQYVTARNNNICNLSPPLNRTNNAHQQIYLSKHTKHANSEPHICSGRVKSALCAIYMYIHAYPIPKLSAIKRSSSCWLPARESTEHTLMRSAINTFIHFPEHEFGRR